MRAGKWPLPAAPTPAVAPVPAKSKREGAAAAPAKLSDRAVPAAGAVEGPEHPLLLVQHDQVVGIRVIPHLRPLPTHGLDLVHHQLRHRSTGRALTAAAAAAGALSSLTALKAKIDATNPQGAPPRHPPDVVTSLSVLMSLAHEHNESVHEVVKAFVLEMGAIEYKPGPLKKQERVEEKTRSDYKGDYRLVVGELGVGGGWGGGNV